VFQSAVGVSRESPRRVKFGVVPRDIQIDDFPIGIAARVSRRNQIFNRILFGKLRHNELQKKGDDGEREKSQKLQSPFSFWTIFCKSGNIFRR
jgi:hypothetical protein